MKSTVERIAFYTKKVAEYTANHPSKRRNPYRIGRLETYKKLMHEQIAKSREVRGINDFTS